MTRLNQIRRQQIGYVYPQQVQNDVSLSTETKRLYSVVEQSFSQNMRKGMYVNSDLEPKLKIKEEEIGGGGFVNNGISIQPSVGGGLSPAGGGLSPAGGGLMKNSDISVVKSPNNAKQISVKRSNSTKDKPLPGDLLRNKILKKIIKDKKGGSLVIRSKGKNGSPGGQSMSKTLPSSKDYKINPKPLVGAGLLKINSNMMIKKFIPRLLSELKIPESKIPIKLLNKMILKVIKNKGQPKDIAKVIMPILVKGKFNHMSKKMSGQGIMDILRKMPDSLSKKLGDLIMMAIKGNINKNLQKKGKPKMFKGSGIIEDLFTGTKAKKFWSGFSRGFKKVFVPIAKMGAPVLSALGLPEVGVPLGIAAEML